MKRIILVVFLLFALSVSVSAEQDIYAEQYEKSGAAELENNLPDEVRDYLISEDISPAGSDWVNKITAGNIFTLLWDSMKSGGKTPFSTALAAVGLSLAVSAFRLFSEKRGLSGSLDFISVSAAAGLVLLPLFAIITSSARTLKAAAQFMLSFIPVYCGVLVASGRPVTGGASGGVLLVASETVVWLAASVIIPLMGAYLAITLCSSLSPAVNLSGLCDAIKKTATWGTGLIMTVYIGVLGMQTTVNTSADNLAVKTGKFLIGSFVPVVGSAVGEALTAVQSSVSLLRSSVGIYGALAVALIVLPAIAGLIVWRVCLMLSAAAATVLDCPKIAALLRGCDSAVAFTLAMTVICSVALIISLAVLAAGG